MNSLIIFSVYYELTWKLNHKMYSFTLELSAIWSYIFIIIKICFKMFTMRWTSVLRKPYKQVFCVKTGQNKAGQS